MENATKLEPRRQATIMSAIARRCSASPILRNLCRRFVFQVMRHSEPLLRELCSLEDPLDPLRLSDPIPVRRISERKWPKYPELLPGCVISALPARTSFTRALVACRE